MKAIEGDLLLTFCFGRVKIEAMNPRMNQLVVNILLLIVIAGIVAYLFVNLAELVNNFSNVVESSIMNFNFGL